MGILKIVKTIMVATFLFLSACNAPIDDASQNLATTAFAEKPLNFKLHITDAPNDDLQSVFVNIKQFELLVAGKGKQARVIMQENFGALDLMTLQNGKSLPIDQFNIPIGLEIKQIRLLLEADGHYAVRKNGSECFMQTPSGQQSGVKVILSEKVTIEEGFSYAFLIDFDAKKSVVQKGNGDCLLKPTLKIKNALKAPLSILADADADADEVAATPGGQEPDEPTDENFEDLANEEGFETVTSGDNLDDVVDSEGFDLHDPSTWPEGITSEDLGSYF